MLTMKLILAVAASVWLAAADPTPVAQLQARYSAIQYKGCYSSAGSLIENGTYQYQSSGYCQMYMCGPMGAPVEATSNGSTCYCGNQLPPAADLVSDSVCNMNCTGYGPEMCGGQNAFSVYLSGAGTYVDPSTDSSSSAVPSSSPTKSAAPSVVTIGGQTVVVTAGSQTSTTTPSSGPNKAAIAAGVVVGFIAFAAAAAGGGYLYMRHRRNRQVEEEYRRNAAVSEFVAGGKSSHSHSAGSFSDTRLDPTLMADRRMSDGSIADNQDYSRRILKVTNA